jgi:hypothetical protein
MAVIRAAAPSSRGQTQGREGDILAMTATAFAIYVAAGGLALLVYAALH